MDAENEDCIRVGEEGERPSSRVPLRMSESSSAWSNRSSLCSQLLLVLMAPLAVQASEGCYRGDAPKIQIAASHPWRPPFGLERVGAPKEVRIDWTSTPGDAFEYFLVGYRGGQETAREALKFSVGDSRLSVSTILLSIPEEVRLFVRCADGADVREIARHPVAWPDVEAEAEARPEEQVNPVDLGTVLVPHNWVLLSEQRTAIVNVAAIAPVRNIPDALISVWFDEGHRVNERLPLPANKRIEKSLRLPVISGRPRAILHVSLSEQGRELWRKEIPAMLVKQPPAWPSFGAVETKLRYDAPISVKNRSTGAYSSIKYDDGWDSSLKDVVVFLPNGTRFVFWRGSSYIPFWAGLYNTGLTYQWAETVPPPGYVDCVEPLQDKELRFGRVQIVESTSSRVHIRWTYESVDVDYKSLGDAAVEDFYFYPDGFGTRVLTLTSAPTADYEITEFITLLPQSAYPFDLLPDRLLEILYLDGVKQSIQFPHRASSAEKDLGIVTQRSDPKPIPRIYRFFSEKRDAAAAIYFSPYDVPVVQQFFKPFYDRGDLVTPGYWGNHWPLGRGAPTGGAIDERIDLSPAHISTFGWGLWSGGNRPKPIFTGMSNTIDLHGRARQMLAQRWSWLIGKTDASDNELLKWAQSYTAPPALEVEGARLDLPSYSPERRAIRIVAEAAEIRIKLTPRLQTMNPVFEVDAALGELISVEIDSKRLLSEMYAWDGRTLWIRSSFGQGGGVVSLQFMDHRE